MKPTFALNLSNESVGLLHRTPRGWLPIGEANFAAPDLNEALSYLRSAALGLSPRGITTKLVIPSSQILYLEIEAPGPDAAARRRQIKAALKEHTQVPVEDLVFDWSGKGKTVQVAVLERVTLEEAEAFAVENRFNPVSFVAIPDPARFKGEPWFGSTKVASSILAPGEKVERDSEAIAFAAREVPVPEPETTAVSEGVESASVAPVPQSAALEPARAEEVRVEPLPEPVVPKELPLAPPPEVPQQAPEVEPYLPPAIEPLSPPEIETVAPVAAESFVAPKPAIKPAAAFPPPSPTPAPQFASAPPPVAQPAVPETLPPDEAPMALDVPGDAKPLVVSDLPEDDLPPPPSPAAMAAFASRRNAEAAVPRPLANPSLGKPPGLGAAGAKPAVERPAMARPVPRMPAEGLAGRNDAAPRPLMAPQKPLGRPETSKAEPAAKTEPATRTLKGLGALVTATTIPGGRKKKVEQSAPVPAPIPATPVPQTPAPQPFQTTASGSKPVTKAASNAFGTKPMPKRGKPRFLGLILTGILLLFLALVAAWSKFYLASSSQTETSAIASNEVATEPQPSAAELQEMSAAEAEADGQDVDLANIDPSVSTASGEATPEQSVASESQTATAEPAAGPDSTGEDGAAVALAAPETVVSTEGATVTSPSPENQDEIFLAAMDAPPATVDPVSLSAPTARGDPLPAAQLPPPPFGTVYQFDADGNILPTPEGIITPEGVRLVAGPPPKVPPVRPASLEAAAVTPLPPSASTGQNGEATIDTFEANPALAGARPKLRPADLAPPQQQGETDPSLAPASDSRFASLRPKARPATVFAASEEARLATATASLANPSVVAVSLVPAQRPKELSRAVEAAVAVAAQQPDPVSKPEPVPVAAAQPSPEPEPAVAAKPQKPVEPEAEEEPEVASNASPQLQGTVAKKATFTNAINLGKLNLIGVYGTPAKRYALVRLPSGRYKKVKVGDTVDGGKIAAISTNEIKYQKGGQIQTLGMPKGTD